MRYLGEVGLRGKALMTGARRASTPLSPSPVLPSPASWRRPNRASTAGSSREGLGVLCYGGAVLFGCRTASLFLLPPPSPSPIQVRLARWWPFSHCSARGAFNCTRYPKCVAEPFTELGNLFGVAPKHRGYPFVNADRLYWSAYAYASFCTLLSNLC